MYRALTEFDWLVVNTSGGKDSQTMLREVVRLASAAGVLNRVVAVHADLGRMEWDGVKDLVRQQCRHYGVPLLIVQYRNNKGAQPTLLDYIRKRRKWPSSTARFCTSDFKRGPCGRIFTQLSAGRQDKQLQMLNIFGFRAQESPARAKRAVFSRNLRLTNRKRLVWDWLPIHDWTEEQVWKDVKASGVPYHPAYDLGMPRLSCCFCIFAPKAALMIAGTANPQLLAEYVALEKEIGHDFQHKKPIAEIQAAIERGEEPGQMSGNWNM